MNKSTVLLASTTVAFGICSIYLFQMLRAEHDRAGALQTRVTAVEHVERAAETPQAAPASTPPAFEPQPPLLKTAVTRPGQEPPAEAREAFRRRLTHPTYRAARLAYSRLEVERQYPDLATALNLQPNEANRLLDLLAKQVSSQEEYDQKRHHEGPMPDAAAVQARRQQDEERRRADEAERAALLGEARLNELNQYLGSLGARAQARELRTMLADSDYPLRQDQVAPFVASLAAEQRRHEAERAKLYNAVPNPNRSNPEEVIRYMGQRMDLIEQSLQRRRAAASAYLDPEQQKRYGEMLDRERARAQIDHDLFVTVNQEAPRAP